MTHNIIFISGFGGAGKTTCGQLLFSRLKSAAFIEADWFFTAKPLPAVGEKIARLKLNGTDAMVRNYLREGFQTVIVVGYVWSQEELDAIMLKLKDLDAQFHLFWLEASPSTRHPRVLSRPGETASKEWLEGVERAIKNPWPLKHSRVRCQRIQVEDKDAEAVVNEIVRAL